ncbi:Very-long-chain (3R)-3-hydroxyacyl-CoA dehydratase PASTICCINO 2 [Capsicum annuum]|nr:Very-long-chain (3R)-3-hydroxyacyl-CoA dehydratase PASTICCINO 2 [Capsicum annuum]
MAGILSLVRRIYLSFYNWIVFFGWFQVFYLAVKTLKESGHEHVYDAVEKPLLLAQTAAILELRSHILVSSLVISWSVTEIIRYSFFGTKEAFGSAPSWLLWLRYSTFLLLYPSGITSEVGLIYSALPYITESGKYSLRMPNKWNFSFDYYYAGLVALGSPHMYGYMLGQRKKALSKSKKE